MNPTESKNVTYSIMIYMLWFNFILGLTFIFFCFWVW